MQKMPWEEDWSEMQPAQTWQTVTTRRDPLAVARDAREERRDERADERDRRAAERDAARLRNEGAGVNDHRFDNISNLRKEFTGRKEVQDFNVILPQVASAMKIARDPKATGADDLSLIYTFGKVMDPGSVVREAELAMASSTGSFAQNLEAAAGRIRSGERLPADIRRNLVNAMHRRGIEMARAYNQSRQAYVALADRNGFNPEDVVGAHPAKPFQQIEADFTGHKIGNFDGTVGAMPGGMANTPAGGTTVATGKTRTEFDKEGSAIIDRLVRRGASVEQANQALAALGLGAPDPAQYAAAVKHARENPTYRGSYGAITREKEQSLINRAAGSQGGAATLSFLGGASAGLLDEGVGAIKSAVTGQPYADAVAEADRARFLSAAAYPTTSLLGNIAGAAAGQLGAGAALRGVGIAGLVPQRFSTLAGDVGFGALTGAGENNDNRLSGAGAGSIGAAVGNQLGAQVTRAGGRLLRGIQSLDVHLLRDAGIPLTAGQALTDSGLAGRTVRGIEDRVAGLPAVGDVVNARRGEGFNAFNRVTFDQGLGPIGETTGGITGARGVELGFDATTRGYRRALDGVSVPTDPQFDTAMRAADAMGRNTPTYGADFASIMDREIAPIAGTSPTITGQQFQDLNRTLGGYERQYGQIAEGSAAVPPAPMARPVSTAFGDMNDALDGVVQRNGPANVLPDYQAARGAYRNMSVIRDAVSRARAGSRTGEVEQFAPSQLADAAAANARRYGGTQGTTDVPFYDLARAGQRILPNKAPDSGTAGRYAVLAAPALIGGGYDRMSNGDGTGTLGGVALGLGALAGGSRIGQRALVSAMMDRFPMVEALGNQAVRHAQLSGMMFGRPLGVSAATAGSSYLLPQ